MVKEHSRSFKNRGHVNMAVQLIISTRTLNVHRQCVRASPEISTCEVTRGFKKFAADFVCNNGVVEVSLLHV